VIISVFFFMINLSSLFVTIIQSVISHLVGFQIPHDITYLIFFNVTVNNELASPLPAQTTASCYFNFSLFQPLTIFFFRVLAVVLSSAQKHGMFSMPGYLYIFFIFHTGLLIVLFIPFLES